MPLVSYFPYWVLMGDCKLFRNYDLILIFREERSGSLCHGLGLELSPGLYHGDGLSGQVWRPWTVLLLVHLPRGSKVILDQLKRVNPIYVLFLYCLNRSCVSFFSSENVNVRMSRIPRFLKRLFVLR